jgi:hypothetical protein
MGNSGEFKVAQASFSAPRGGGRGPRAKLFFLGSGGLIVMVRLEVAMFSRNWGGKWWLMASRKSSLDRLAGSKSLDAPRPAKKREAQLMLKTDAPRGEKNWTRLTDWLLDRVSEGQLKGRCMGCAEEGLPARASKKE